MNDTLIRITRPLFFVLLLLCLPACESEKSRVESHKENIAILKRYGAEFSTLPAALPEGWMLVGIDTGRVDTTMKTTPMPTTTVMLEFAPQHDPAQGNCSNHVQFRFYPASYETGVREVIRKYLRLREGRSHPPLPESWRNEKYFVNIFPCFCGDDFQKSDICLPLIQAVTTHFQLQPAPNAKEGASGQ